MTIEMFIDKMQNSIAKNVKEGLKDIEMLIPSFKFIKEIYEGIITKTFMGMSTKGDTRVEDFKGKKFVSMVSMQVDGVEEKHYIVMSFTDYNIMLDAFKNLEDSEAQEFFETNQLSVYLISKDSFDIKKKLDVKNLI